MLGILVNAAIIVTLLDSGPGPPACMLCCSSVRLPPPEQVSRSQHLPVYMDNHWRRFNSAFYFVQRDLESTVAVLSPAKVWLSPNCQNTHPWLLARVFQFNSAQLQIPWKQQLFLCKMGASQSYNLSPSLFTMDLRRNIYKVMMWSERLLLASPCVLITLMTLSQDEELLNVPNTFIPISLEKFC